jgi:hypothetical protein
VAACSHLHPAHNDLAEMSEQMGDALGKFYETQDVERDGAVLASLGRLMAAG